MEKLWESTFGTLSKYSGSWLEFGTWGKYDSCMFCTWSKYDRYLEQLRLVLGAITFSTLCKYWKYLGQVFGTSNKYFL